MGTGRGLFSVVMIIAVFAVACGQSETSEPTPVPTEQPATPVAPAEAPAAPAKAPAAPAAEAAPATPPPPPREPGALPFEWPRQQKVNATAGQYVLFPPVNWINKAFEKGISSTTFIFYASKMAEPGEYQSKITRLSGSDETIPNALIVPIKSGQTASPGDILLTWWQSGSGMQRSIVVDGGSPTEPNVRHLDLDLDNPSGVGKRVDTLRPDSFHKLTQLWEHGTAVACKEGTRYRHGLIINTLPDKVLTIGFAGRMKVFSKASCVPLPVRPRLKVGQQVWTEHMGGMTEGVVKRLDAKIGRAFIEIEWGGSKRELGSPFGDIATEPLP